MEKIEWDDKAAEAFASYELDMQRGFEIEDPDANITSMDELLHND